MIEITGFTVKKSIFKSPHIEVYTALRHIDNKNVILKIVSTKFPNIKSIARLQHEYNLLSSRKLPGFLDPKGLVKYQDMWVLELEGEDGESLETFLKGKPLDLRSFFKIALQMIEIIIKLHHSRLIHKDIKPSNFIIHPQSLIINLIDVSIASGLIEETQEYAGPKMLEGTLAYMSPEQTGRLNRIVDYRSDLYSLGISFYQMLTGHLPFDSDDPLEIVYSHIAKAPAEIAEQNPTVPDMLSQIVMKLIEKIPEKRYESAIGLKDDMEQCQKEWLKTGKVEKFALGKNDVYNYLHVSQKLYGRERQVDELYNAFNEVLQGESKVAFITGYSGIGKTSIVGELYKKIAERSGYLISGKFEQLQRTIPYSAFIKAFRDLIQQTLTESDENLKTIRNDLSQVVGNLGQVIIEIIPEFEFILGKQPPLDALNPHETQYRFHHVFKSVVQYFAKPEHPLVIFLDDLQWIDNDSLKLLEALLSDGGVPYLFVIGAYRDIEVAEYDSLMLTVKKLKEQNGHFLSIHLMPLEKKEIDQMLMDTFNCDAEKVDQLSTLVIKKTLGNPFFINQFLKSLYENELIHFSSATRSWEWKINEIYDAAITDNVVILMTEKIKRLPIATQDILKLASCIGYTFDLHSLAIISGQPLNLVIQQLSHAININLIVPSSDVYKNMIFPGNTSPQAEEIIYLLNEDKKINFHFIHDRVHQVVYESIPEITKKKDHLKIGRVLTQEKPLDENDDRIFIIMNHYNYGIDLVEDPADKHNLAVYNLLAGKKAKLSIAYQIAEEYLKCGIKLLSDDAWRTNYDLYFSLQKEYAECLYHNSNFKLAEKKLKMLLSKARNSLDKADIYILYMNMYMTMDKFKEALKSGITALKLFNIKFPDNPGMVNIFKMIMELYWRFNFIKNDKRENPMVDVNMKRVMDILMQLATAGLTVSPELYAYAMFKMAILSLQYGYTYPSPASFFGCAIVFLGELNMHALAFKLSDFALQLSQHFDKNLDPKSSVLYGALVFPWKYPCVDSLEILKHGYQTGVEVGDLNIASYNLSAYAHNAFYCGKPLPEVQKNIQAAIGFMKKYKIEQYENSDMSIEIAIRYMMQSDANLKFDELNDFIKNIETLNNKTEISEIYNVLTKLYFFLGDPEKALPLVLKAKEFSNHTNNYMTNADAKFFSGLIYAACYDKMRNFRKKNIYKKELIKLIKLFKTWVSWCPENYEHCYLLLLAELARIEDRPLEAMQYYDEAIVEAKHNNYIHVVAIANELAAKYYLRLNKENIAQIYATESYDAYQQWGSNLKVHYLEKTYPEWFEKKEATGSLLLNSSLSSSLDYMALLKTTLTISSGMELEALLKDILRILLENSGAERGVLLSKRNNEWVVEAESTLDSHSINLTGSDLVSARHDLPLNLIKYVQRTKEMLVIQDASKDDTAMLDEYVRTEEPKSLLLMPVLYQKSMNRILYLENKMSSHAFDSTHLQNLQILIAQVTISLENAELYTASKRFVPHAFLQRLNKDSLTEVRLGDQIHRNMSIVFCDIQDFTSISDQIPVIEVFKLASQFLGGMEPVIRRYNGFIDKYIGDAVMALFDNADDAVSASLQILAYVEEFNKSYVKSGKKPIKIGIGVNTGELILGVIGSNERMDGSVIGEAVNLASRVEHLTRQYNLPLLITEATRIELKNPNNFELRRVDQVILKGKIEPIDIWEVQKEYAVDEKKRSLSESDEMMNMNKFTVNNKR